MQLLGGLLSVLPERVSKTMQAHKEVLLKRVRGYVGSIAGLLADRVFAADSARTAGSTTAASTTYRQYGQHQSFKQPAGTAARPCSCS
jgi:hypothetical protein